MSVSSKIATTAGRREQKRLSLRAGDRLEVWWPRDRQYYSGTIQEIQPRRRKPHHVLYDDGEEEWLDLGKERFRFIEPAPPRRRKSVLAEEKPSCEDERELSYSSESENEFLGDDLEGSRNVNASSAGGSGANWDILLTDAADEGVEMEPSDLEVGSRIEVYWPQTGTYKTGTVHEISRVNQMFVQYDSGHENWISKSTDNWRLSDRQTKEEATDDGSAAHVAAAKTAGSTKSSSLQDATEPSSWDEKSMNRIKQESKVKHASSSKSSKKKPITRAASTDSPKDRKSKRKLKDTEPLTAGTHSLDAKVKRASSSKSSKKKPITRAALTESPRDRKTKRKLKDTETLTAGTHSLDAGSKIEVYCGTFQTYCAATVLDVSLSLEKAHVQYVASGKKEWIGLAGEKWRLQPETKKARTKTEHPDASVNENKSPERSPTEQSDEGMTDSAKQQPIAIGSRVEVWWEADSEWYAGTVTKKLEDGKDLIEYDDGDEEELDLLEYGKYRLLVPDLIAIGSRVEVHWDDDNQFHSGTVTKKHDQDWWYMEYDDEQIGWINFRETPFAFLADSKRNDITLDVVGGNLNKDASLELESPARAPPSPSGSCDNDDDDDDDTVELLRDTTATISQSQRSRLKLRQNESDSPVSNGQSFINENEEGILIPSEINRLSSLFDDDEEESLCSVSKRPTEKTTSTSASLTLWSSNVTNRELATVFDDVADVDEEAIDQQCANE